MGSAAGRKNLRRVGNHEMSLDRLWLSRVIAASSSKVV
jgi:hypothetical protein